MSVPAIIRFAYFSTVGLLSLTFISAGVYLMAHGATRFDFMVGMFPIVVGLVHGNRGLELCRHLRVKARMLRRLGLS